MDAFRHPLSSKWASAQASVFQPPEKMMADGLIKADQDRRSELVRKHGNTSVSALRRALGRSFALGMPDHEKLSDVIHQLDERSLVKLARESRRARGYELVDVAEVEHVPCGACVSRSRRLD